MTDFFDCAVLLCDNARIHNSEDTVDDLTTWSEANRTRILINPPYSPECNAAEFIFNKLKTKIKYRRLDLSLTVQLMLEMLNINRDEIRKYFLHSLNIHNWWSYSN